MTKKDDDDFSQKQKWAKEVCEDAINHRNITDWEQRFCSSILEQLEDDGLSSKQIDVIEKIEKKIYQ